MQEVYVQRFRFPSASFKLVTPSTAEHSLTRLPRDFLNFNISMKMIDIISFDVDKLLVWFSKFSPSRILASICKVGRDAWNSFRKWFFGINFDHHEWLVDQFMPLMPYYTEAMEESPEKLKLEDCLEIDLSVEEYFNEDIQAFKEDKETGERTMLFDNGTPRFEKKAVRRQTKKIKKGHVEAAIAAVEAKIRNRHMIYGEDMGLVDEAAVRATAGDICGELKINEHHSKLLIYSAAYRAMTPDHDSINAVKLAYNPKSAARRTLVSTIRDNKSFGGFKSLEDF